MSTSTITLQITVKMRDAEDFDPALITQVVDEALDYGICNQGNWGNDSVKEDIIDNIIHVSTERV